MKKIVISGSLKNKNDIKNVINNLNKLNLIPVFPNLDFSPKAEKIMIEEKKFLAMEHYKAIDNSDAMYVIIKNGYIGNSVKLEIGYAFALKKPIYYSEEPNDKDLSFYYEDLISLNELKKLKKEQHVYAEIGFGNDTFFNTEIENWEDGKKKDEFRISKFIFPEKIKEIYFRIWIGKKVYIFSTKKIFSIKNKNRKKFKILFGIGGIGYKKTK